MGEIGLNWGGLIPYHIAFSIYTGWGCAATILGTSIMLRRTGASAFMDHEDTWAIIIACVAFVIYVVTSIRFVDPVFGLVFTWVCIWNVTVRQGSVKYTFLTLGILNIVVQLTNTVRWIWMCYKVWTGALTAPNSESAAHSLD